MIHTGQGFGEGVAFGVSAVLNEDGGRPTLDPELLVQVALNRRRGLEPLDVVLIVEDASRALLLPLPQGLTLVGVVAENVVESLPNPPIPVVTGVSQARKTVPNGVLILADPLRHRVIIEPSAETVAKIQAEGLRPRVRLGAANVPAKTMSDREVQVWAFIESLIHIPEAQEAGADGLFILPDGDLLPPFEDTPAETRSRLRRMAEAWGGGDIALSASLAAVDPLLLCQTAALCRLHWAIRAESLPVPLPDLRRELKRVVQEERLQERVAEVPGLVGIPPPLPESDTREQELEELRGWDLLFVPPKWVLPLSALEILSLPPLFVLLPESQPESQEEIPVLVALGVAGLIVPLSAVADAKNRIREQE